MQTITLSIDAMGGDHGPSVVIPAALDALRSHPHLHLILVGDQETLARVLAAHPHTGLESRYTILHASEQVLMDESPANALRNKKQSSMRLAINCVHEGKAQASVSAGNTGALMATARFVLKTLPGIDRPAIIYSLPTLSPETQQAGFVRVLDLGANVDCQPDNLLQFAVMGSVCASVLDKKEHPRVGLLNIGSEEIKGCEVVKAADQLIRANNQLNYVGFVEANGMYYGHADVVVCDGFVGNVALKASEGVALTLLNALKIELTRTLYTKLLAWLLKPAFLRLKKRYDPRSLNGACLLGLNGIVVKSHGNADSTMFAAAISAAMRLAEEEVPQKIRSQVTQYFAKE